TFKLFEMPILGYFGFVFFSLETILFISFIHESQLVRRHRSWTAIIALAFSLASFAAIDRYTVFSYTATVNQLSFLPQNKREELKRKGIETSFAIDPRQLNQQEKASLALLHLKGLGPANFEKLRQRGIKSIPELARMTEEELSNAIGEKNKRRLRVYLRAARQYRPQ
ncbi:MAG TPA: helix-hairpin-helix domain-containing protein, partial [Syntrophorhabdales bacterium]|nr:helix-hairpin-helix domain-containing protein [Syntrophorhabdales bacterium]